MKSFLSNRYQPVVLNGQASSWADVKAGVPQASILGPLFFLIYINDLSENLKSTVKLFAEDTLTYHAVKDHNTSAEILSHDLTKISEWAQYRWKMSLSPYHSKQPQEVLFSDKATKTNHPNIFNGYMVQNSANQSTLV